jgi:hypothetical protein
MNDTDRLANPDFDDLEQTLACVGQIAREFDGMSTRFRMETAGIVQLAEDLRRMGGTSDGSSNRFRSPQAHGDSSLAAVHQEIEQSLRRKKALGKELCQAAATFARELARLPEDLRGRQPGDSNAQGLDQSDGLMSELEHSATAGTVAEQDGNDKLTGWLTGGWHTGITGSIFGGRAEPQESWYNGRGYYDGKLMLDSDTMPGVALPAEDLYGQKVEIYNLSNGRSVIAPVVDVGPHAVEDDNYVYNFGRPIGESRPNRSGIDLLPQTARDLGIEYVRGRDGYEPVGNDPVLNWRFVQ